MRSAFLFIAGLLVGVSVQGASTQPRQEQILLNHVAIAVPDLDAGVSFYTKVLGAKEALAFRDNRGTPFSYLQLSRETFLELQPAGGTRKVGFLHIGLEVRNLRQALPQFKAAGFTVSEPRESPRTRSLISQATDPNGVHFELLEFGPESAQRKAIDDWKLR